MGSTIVFSRLVPGVANFHILTEVNRGKPVNTLVVNPVNPVNTTEVNPVNTSGKFGKSGKSGKHDGGKHVR